MTQDEIIELARQAGFDCYGKHITWDDVICTDELKAFAKLVAAKAIAELESQEPVAWCRYEDGMWVYYETKAWDDLQPLYTHPPQRTWAGLTNDELTDLFYNTNLGQASAVAQAIELLKEKNT